MTQATCKNADKKSAKTSQKPKEKSVAAPPPLELPEHEGIKAKKVRQEIFLKELCANRFNVSTACRLTGIARRTFYRWMEEDPEFMEQHEDVLESRVDKWEECLHKNILAGSDRAITYALDAHGRKRGYGKGAETQDQKVIDILAQVVADTLTVVEAAYQITMLGYPLPEVIKIQLQKGAGEGEGGEEDRAPKSDAELDAMFYAALASVEQQRETFLPERQQEVLALKEELKAQESFGPGGEPVQFVANADESF